MKKIIQNFKDMEMSTDPVLIKSLVEKQYQPVSQKIIDYVNNLVIKNCAVVFSGGQQLSTADAYVEYKHIKDLGLPLNQKSLFLDKNNVDLINLTLSKLKVSTLVFLHSPEFSYLTLNEILLLIDYYKTHTNKQIIVAVSIFNICFNRLSTNLEELEKSVGGKFIDNHFVISV